MDYLENIKSNLQQLCQECKDYGTEQCIPLSCNVGFAKKVLQYAKDNQVLNVDGGELMVPRQDFRYFEPHYVASSLANICKMCKQCAENHNENCIISLCRRSLESIILSEAVEYPGNTISYLFNLKKVNESFSRKVQDCFEKLP